jgi:glycosyltransferase involved in cell wall biosynthesis
MVFDRKNIDIKKLIVFASSFPRDNSNDMPLFIKEQVDYLSKNYRDLDISVLAPHRGDSPSFEAYDNYKVYRFPYFWPRRFQKLADEGIMPSLKQNKLLYFQVPFFFLFESIALLRLIKNLKPNYIYAHWFTPQGLVSSIVTTLTGIPFIFTSHSSDVEIWTKIPIIGNKIVKIFASRAMAITVVSKRSYEKLKGFYSEMQWKKIEPRVKIIPMGIDLSLYAHQKANRNALKEEYGLKDKKILFFIGRLVEKKGVSYLLKAFSKLISKHPSLILVIAGDGQKRLMLEKEADSLGIRNRTKFVGALSGQTKLDYFYLSDIFILPSIITKEGDAEGLPVVLMEALAAGKICIATDVSGADDILVHCQNGYIIGSKNVDAIVNFVNDALSQNDTDRSSMAKEAKKTALELDWNVIVMRHYDFFFSSRNNQCKTGHLSH